MALKELLPQNIVSLLIKSDPLTRQESRLLRYAVYNLMVEINTPLEDTITICNAIYARTMNNDTLSPVFGLCVRDTKRVYKRMHATFEYLVWIGAFSKHKRRGLVSYGLR